VRLDFRGRRGDYREFDFTLFTDDRSIVLAVDGYRAQPI
jgi:hypothetical protein